MLPLLDIVFQEGDFFYESSTSIIEKLWSFFVSFCSIGIPLLLFYLGMKKERDNENTKKEKRQFDNLKYFGVLVDNIQVISEKQSNNSKEVAEKIGTNPIEFPELEKVVGSDIKRIVNLVNHEDIFHAYLSRFGNTTEIIKDYRITFSYLDYLDKIYDQHIIDFEKYKIDFNGNYHNFKNISKELMDYIAFQIKEIKSKDEAYEDDAYWIFINNIIVEYYRKIEDDDIENDITYNFNSFINPLKTEMLNKYQERIDSDFIISKAEQATHTYTEIKSLSEEMSSDFSEFAKNFITIKNKIKEKTAELAKINAT